MRKPKHYKKRIRDTEKHKSALRQTMKDFTSEQWLYLIRELNNFIRNESTDINQNIAFKAEFCAVVADLALRISPSNTSSSTSKPTDGHFKKASELFINCDESPSELIKHFGIGGLPLALSWQNRFHYPPNNILGRMFLLYKEYHSDIIEASGVTVYDIYIITLVIIGIYDNKSLTTLNPSMLHHPEIDSLSEEKIHNFFNFFSATKENYYATAKSFKVYDNCFGKYNVMNQYPIIEINEEQYIIPVMEQLIDSVSSNLYYHILSHKQKKGSRVSRAYLNDFGTVLENYVLNATKHIFGEENVIRAETIVTEGDRCEAVVYYEDKAFAIEVKKLNFKLDAIANVDVEYIRKVLEEHLVKAYRQIENTLRYVEKQEMYGLIVIPDSMISPSTLKDYLKQEFSDDNIDYASNIFMCTLSAYESLMGNSKESIFKALSITHSRTVAEGNDIGLILSNMQQEDESITLRNELCSKALEDSLTMLSIENPTLTARE